MTSVRRDEAGSSLVLALVFIFAVGLIIIPVVSLGANAILNNTNLKGQRGNELAADSATNAAVQWVRNACPPGSTQNCVGIYSGTPQACLPSNVASMTLDGVAMTVWCAGTANTGTRTVSFAACQSSVPAAQCGVSAPSSALLRAQVTYYDLNPDNSDTCVPSPPAGSSSSCGIALTIDYWDVSTADN